MTRRIREQKRRRNIRKDAKLIIIISEGECTEPYYFIKFNGELRYSGVRIKTPKVRQTDPISLVKTAINIINKKRSDCRISQEDGDEIYCVYDVDDNSDEDLNSAKELAEKNGIKIFLSNPCFEIWFLLHFEQVNKGISREDLYEQLKKYVKNYEKSSDVYHLLKDLQANAIANAERLNSMHEENGISLSVGACNPSTQVFRMVKYFQSLREGTSYR